MEVNETSTILAGLKTKLGTGTEVEFAPGVQIGRTSNPSIFDMTLKEKHPPAWTDLQAADEFKRAVDLAKDSNIALMVLGENQDMSGEYASRSTLDLPGRQLELLQAVTAAGKPVVLVLINGRRSMLPGRRKTCLLCPGLGTPAARVEILLPIIICDAVLKGNYNYLD